MRWRAPSPTARTTACVPRTSIISSIRIRRAGASSAARVAHRCRWNSSRWSSLSRRTRAESRGGGARRSLCRAQADPEAERSPAHRSPRRRSAGNDAVGADARRRAARIERRAVRPDLRRRLARATAAGFFARGARGVGARRAAAVARRSFQREHGLRSQFPAPSRAAGAARALAGRGSQCDSLDCAPARSRPAARRARRRRSRNRRGRFLPQHAAAREPGARAAAQRPASLDSPAGYACALDAQARDDRARFADRTRGSTAVRRMGRRAGAPSSRTPLLHA